MTKMVFIPDSFKGTLSSAEVCQVMEDCAKAHLPDCETVSVPVADGGEGSVDAFLKALGGEKKYASVSNPFFEPMSAFYGLIDNGNTAVIEMASCAGLPLAEGRANPCKTTTYGVGELMFKAAEDGVSKIILGLGGSATNDGGCGAAAAAGVRFYNALGDTFIPTGGTLSQIERIDASEKNPLLDKVEITVMCDIDNPMFGKTGAAYVFAPQKGADAKTVRLLDEGLMHLSKVMRRDLGKDFSMVPGAGAAGAMGAGMMGFFGGKLQMGIETVLDTVQFDRLIADADVIFTGEGKLDSQSLRGKVVIGVARRAKQQNKPVIAVVGGADIAASGIYGEGVTAVFAANPMPVDFSVSRCHAKENLTFTMDNLARLLKQFCH